MHCYTGKVWPAEERSERMGQSISWAAPDSTLWYNSVYWTRLYWSTGTRCVLCVRCVWLTHTARL